MKGGHGDQTHPRLGRGHDPEQEIARPGCSSDATVNVVTILMDSDDSIYGSDGRLGEPIERTDDLTGMPGWGEPQNASEITACERAAAALGLVEDLTTITEFYRRAEDGKLVPLQGWARIVRDVPIFVPVPRIIGVVEIALLSGIAVSTAYKMSRLGQIVGKLPPVGKGAEKNGRVRVIRDAFLLSIVQTILKNKQDAAKYRKLAEIKERNERRPS